MSGKYGPKCYAMAVVLIHSMAQAPKNAGPYISQNAMEQYLFIRLHLADKCPHISNSMSRVGSAGFLSEICSFQTQMKLSL